MFHVVGCSQDNEFMARRLESLNRKCDLLDGIECGATFIVLARVCENEKLRR